MANRKISKRTFPHFFWGQVNSKFTQEFIRKTLENQSKPLHRHSIDFAN